MAVEYVTAYLQTLDRVYKNSAASAFLESDITQFRLNPRNPKTISTRSISTEGAADYDRTTGYDADDVDVAWEDHTFSQDRGKALDFDVMDAEESETDAVEVAAEFTREHIVPDVDAYRFKKLYTIKGSADAAVDLDQDDVLHDIDAGTETMDDNEVPDTNRLLFVSNSVYTLMKRANAFTDVRVVNLPVYPELMNVPGLDTKGIVITRKVAVYDDMPVIKVPKNRFSTAANFSATNGFAAAGYYINFMIVHRPGVIAFVKHNPSNIILPQDHQSKDAYRIKVRAYHDLFLPQNKVNGVYIHRKATGI